jgi:hypothetical protein
VPSRVCIKLLTWLARSKGKSAVSGCQKTPHDHPNERPRYGVLASLVLISGLSYKTTFNKEIMDLEFSVVFDKAQFAEFVHETRADKAVTPNAALA